MDPFTIGNFIRQLRIKRSYTQRRLGQLLDISHTEVQSWEDGQVIPSDAMFNALSKLFQVTQEELKQGHLNVVVNPTTEKAKQIALSIVIYGGLIIVLLGISLFLFATRVFVVHIVFIAIVTLLMRFVVFRLQPKSRLRQYFSVVAVVLTLFALFMMFDTTRMVVLREERIVMNEYKEHLYLGELGPESEVVIFYSQNNTMMAIVYREEREHYAIVPLTNFQTTDIIEVDTTGEVIIDVVRHEDKVLISTMETDYTGPFKIYEFDTTGFTDTVVFQSDTVYKMYGSWSGVYLWEHHLFMDASGPTDILRLYEDNEVYVTDLLRTVPYLVWDMIEYDWEYTTRTLLSTPSGEIENGLMLNQIVMVDNSFMESGEVLIEDLQNPVWFDQEWKKAFAYNEDVVFTIVEDDVEEVKGIHGFYDFMVISEGLYFGDHQFFDEDFNVIQRNVLYDSDYNTYDLGAEMFSDENGNFYTLDNEFMGFCVIYQNEPDIWTLPLGARISYMVFSTIVLGFLVQGGQRMYQNKVHQVQEE
jgi:transcriptional regulator with XRE-family HTH domain